jgi:hypothetical protein
MWTFLIYLEFLKLATLSKHEKNAYSTITPYKLGI